LEAEKSGRAAKKTGRSASPPARVFSSLVARQRLRKQNRIAFRREAALRLDQRMNFRSVG